MMTKLPSAKWPPLSKSRYVAGCQCLKRLYYQVHARELAAEPDDATQVIFDQGHEVGAVARQAFPGGVLVEEDHTQHDQAVAKTATLLKDPKVCAIFEAAFLFQGIKVRADIIERLPRGRWRLIEVKQATSVKGHYLHDVAVQRHVLEGCGLKIASCAIMHINRDYLYVGGAHPPDELFVISDVTTEMKEAFAAVSAQLKAARKALRADNPPDVDAGAQCHEPYQCEFTHVCCTPLPVGHISHLPGLRRTHLERMLADGIESIAELDESLLSSDAQLRALQSVVSGRTVYTKADPCDLPSSDYEMAFMDFETLSLALPRYAGTRPYQQLPFQWSVAIQRSDRRGIMRYDHLADGSCDPRPSFIASLLQVLNRHPGPIVVYHQTFEQTRLQELAQACPRHAKAIAEVIARLWDLLPCVRQHVYDPEFRGSFSLKSVYPALIGGGYDQLEIQDGLQAAACYLRSLSPDCSAREGKALRNSLIQYCRQDVTAMVEILGHLRKRTRK